MRRANTKSARGGHENWLLNFDCTTATRASFAVIKEHAFSCMGRDGKERERDKEIGSTEREKERDPISDNIWTSRNWKRRYIGIGNERKRKEKKN